DFQVFDRVFIPAANGAQIPLKQLADIRFESSANFINHRDLERFVLVSAFVADGYLTPSVYSEFLKKLEKVEFPPGYSYQMSGEIERQAETFGGLGAIIAITVF